MASLVFNDLQRLQRPSKRLKGFKGFKEVQRPSKAPAEIEVAGHGREGPGSTMIKMERSTGVLQKCNTFCCDVALVQQYEQLTRC